MKFLRFSQTKLGSSFDITRARVGGASVIPLLSSFLFSVPPSRRKVLGAKSPPEAGRQSAGKKEGGWGEVVPEADPPLAENFCPPASVPVPFEQRKSGREIRYEEKSSISVNCFVLHHHPDDVHHLSAKTD